jgi:hypothetical protein
MARHGVWIGNFIYFHSYIVTTSFYNTISIARSLHSVLHTPSFRLYEYLKKIAL